MEEDFDETTMDACLIAAGQRAEHYEMAAYGTLVAWAQAMGHTEAAKLLQQTLDEEKAADKKLSGLAEGGINQSAADAAHPDEDEEAEDRWPAAAAGRRLGEGRSPVDVWRRGRHGADSAAVAVVRRRGSWRPHGAARRDAPGAGRPIQRSHGVRPIACKGLVDRSGRPYGTGRRRYGGGRDGHIRSRVVAYLRRDAGVAL